jgi:hypothetical protein
MVQKFEVPDSQALIIHLLIKAGTMCLGLIMFSPTSLLARQTTSHATLALAGWLVLAQK